MALRVQRALPGCCAVARGEREGSSCPPSPPPKHRPGDRQSRTALWPPAGEAVFSSVNFPCPSLSSGQLPCVTAPPATPLQRDARQACGSGLPPCGRPGTEAGQPENLSGLKSTPSCMCFCNWSYWKSHPETLFVKEKKAFRDQMSSLFQLLKAGCGQPMFTFLSPFREQGLLIFLALVGPRQLSS